MATKIKMSASDIDNIIARIRAQLQAKKCTESTLNVVAVPTKDDRTATLYITPAAWCKMAGLVAEYGTEVEWHGLARRISECEYEIYDVLVFPHEVTGTTVVADQTKYTEWIESLDDETFNALKMHGHSHVNMSTTPSSVDETYRSNLVSLLPSDGGDDTFYIFMIVNKSWSINAEIFDVSQNARYSNAEVDIGIELGGDGYLDGFIANAKKLITEAKTTYASSYTTAPLAEAKKGAKNTKKSSAKSVYDSYDDNDWDNLYGRYYGGGSWT